MTNSAIVREAEAAPVRAKASNYPAMFARLVAGRIKKPLGDLFSLRNFGVNLTRLPPGTVSALHHGHSRQDEFIYVLEGCPTLFVGDERIELKPGMCAGFPAAGDAHHLRNDSDADVVYLEVGDRSPDDEVHYPDDDLKAIRATGGSWFFTHKDGSPY